ncbi:hypothetical protein FJTKL_02023 [Diaporthe vaccinii]|uniref:SET domain-containing protein n=1 Tax=Diaporthe vaccinii TaxID=105482 RepID=A0ABR4DZB2_9PEZI
MTKRDIGTKYLHTHIVQKMLHNIEAARSFGDLHHGDYDAVSVHEVDGRPVVDSFLVQKVIDLVSLEGPRTSLSAYQDFVSIGDEDQDDDVSNVGVWHLISHINHSCISNTNDSLIGDMRIVRATRDLEKGSELFMSYQASFDVDSYEEMQERLRPWGFTCDCALCLDRKATPKEVLMKRDSLLQILMQLLESQSRNMDITYAQLKKTLQSLEQTYSATAKMSGAARPVLWISYFTLGSELLDIEGPSEAIEMTLKGLEALGFVISASPPRWRPESSEPELLINRWGVTNRPTVDAFLALHRAYKKIAPQLSVVARKYMELAYSMVVGEKETILDSYPDMA